jgi:hypothetical protein
MSLRSRLLAILLFLVVPVALAPVGAMAQQPAPAPSAGATAANATVHGMVVDPDDALIPGATVTLTPATGKVQSTTSKSDGTYSIRGLAAGMYSVTVSATGFANFTKQAVRVAAGANVNVDATMALAEQVQQVNVTTDTVSLSVDPENNASSTVITGAALDALPGRTAGRFTLTDLPAGRCLRSRPFWRSASTRTRSRRSTTSLGMGASKF